MRTVRAARSTVCRVKEPSRSTRTPTLTLIVTQTLIGVVLVVFALLNGLQANGDTAVLLSVAIGAVGGANLGMALGMERHRRASGG
jgi:hypothetical protein